MPGNTKGHRPSAVDHLAAQVVIGLPADPTELHLASCRVLSRHEPDPSGKLAPAAEMPPVINTGEKRGRDNGANPGEGR